MIFLTVGTQLPFDRLLKCIDEWCEINTGVDVYAQIGASSYIPRNYDYSRYLDESEHRGYMKKSRLVIGHAGIGTILGALTYAKPVAIMARRLEFLEHRNDHQVATLARFSSVVGVYSFDDLAQFDIIYNKAINQSFKEVSPVATDEFLRKLEQKFVADV